MARTPLLRALRKLLRQQQISRRLNVSAESLRDSLAQRPITRRAFIAGGAALAATAALPRGARASDGDTRVVIVGGGIAGLTCALTLADRGIDATVYEASTRAGGRIFSTTGYWKHDQITEWGGELIDTGHQTIRRLAQRFNLTLDDVLGAQPAGSSDTYYLFGHYYTKAQADADFAALVDVVDADLGAAGYPTTFDSYTREGKMLDEMSIAQWIDARVPGGRSSPLGAMLDIAYAIEYGADSDDQSALNLLYLLGYQPTPGELAVFGESDEHYHIRGGNDQLPRAIARELGEDCFELGQRLVRIAQTPAQRYLLTFKSLDGETRDVTADYVVLALPFSVLREIDCAQAGFDALKHQAIQELGRGRSAKTQLQFHRRLWNTRGPWGISNGSSYSDTGYQASWEPTRGQRGAGGVINFFSSGSVTEAMRSTRAFATAANPNVRADALDTLRRAEPVFPGLSAFWNGKATQSLPHLSPLARASYAYYRVGQYTAFGGYEGVTQGGVLFAGDHTSQDFQGFMEGAASEGKRAGHELAALVRD